jgi:hypothetical protein
MIVYRKKMQDNNICERDIQFIQKKAIDFSIEIKNKMIINNSGHSQATPSYNLNDLIVAQAEYTGTCRPQVKKRNVEVLAILRKLRDDLIEKDLDFKRVQKKDSVTADMV